MAQRTKWTCLCVSATQTEQRSLLFLAFRERLGEMIGVSGATTLSSLLSGETAGRPTSLPLKYFYNGRIRTMDRRRSVVPHMLVAGERIWFCAESRAPLGLDFREAGFAAQRRAWESEIEFIDLEKRTVLPGLADAHVHFLQWAMFASRPDLTSARSEEEALAILRQEATPEGEEWLVAFGWSHNEWPGGRLPSKESLDAVFPHRPVYATSKCGHLAWVNSAALARAGITPATPDPPGGEIGREMRNGVPFLTGVLKENAIYLVERHIPTPTESVRRNAFLKAQAKAHALGITAIHTPEDLEAWDFYLRARATGLLRLRTAFLAPVQALPEIASLRLRHGMGDDWLFLAGIKVFADGSLGGRTALMYEAYEGEPHNSGVVVTDYPELLRVTIQANRAGLPVAIHAIGDLAVGQVLRAFAASAVEVGTNGAVGTQPLVRNRIEHLQLYAECDLELLREVRPVASMQPVHLCADWKAADEYWGKRARRAYAFHTLSRCGCLLAFGSDAPVEPINPWFGLYAATTRLDLCNERATPWYREEQIPLEDAVAAYTLGPARAVGKLHVTGSLEVGKYADFVVLEEDPFTIPPKELRNVIPYETYVSGECVHKWIASEG
ncbi:MAG: amidohydrolase family protein [Candidatus Sumerlaea chitinivorans]|nr:amidohydrolase family protein [Candidatus Sumerlaea chitinivorans]